MPYMLACVHGARPARWLQAFRIACHAAGTVTGDPDARQRRHAGTVVRQVKGLAPLFLLPDASE